MKKNINKNTTTKNTFMVSNILCPTLDFNEIKYYSYLMSFTVSLLCTFLCHYGINDFSLFAILFKSYLSVDLFFTPFQRIDIFIHHLIFIFLISAVNTGHDKMDNELYIFLKTEISSNFLTLRYLLPYWNIKQKAYQQILDLGFALSFFKLRIWDLSYYYFMDESFHRYLQHIFHQETMIAILIKINLVTNFLLLNYYWFYLILKKFFMLFTKVFLKSD